MNKNYVWSILVVFLVFMAPIVYFGYYGNKQNFQVGDCLKTNDQADWDTWYIMITDVDTVAKKYSAFYTQHPFISGKLDFLKANLNYKKTECPNL